MHSAARSVALLWRQTSMQHVDYGPAAAHLICSSTRRVQDPGNETILLQTSWPLLSLQRLRATIGTALGLTGIDERSVQDVYLCHAAGHTAAV